MSRRTILLTVIFPLLAAIGPPLRAQDRRHQEWWREKYKVVGPEGSSMATRAFGIFSRIKPLAETKTERDPKLLIIEGGGETTVVAIEDGTIVLPMEAIDLCYQNRPAAEGDQLLAFVLGHELSHLASDEFRHLDAFLVRERHVVDPQARERLDELDPLRASAKTESEADDRGLVLMTMAGFDPEVVAAAGTGFFESWLRSIPYGFSSQNGAYPTPGERAAFVRARLRETADKLEYFELGVRFYQMGLYEEAISLFELFVRQFPGRAVLNNLGLSHLQAAAGALAACDSQLVLRFKLPLLLDPDTLAKGVKRGGPSGCYQEPRFVLHKVKATEYFERAIKGSPDYHPAYLNLISLLILSNDGAGALRWAQRMLESQPGDPEVEGLSAVAIHLYDQQDRYLDTENAGLKKIRALTRSNPASATVAFNRARLELEVFGAAGSQAAWREFLALEARGAYARAAREHAGLETGPAAEADAVTPGNPPSFPVPDGDRRQPWLDEIDPNPLRIDSGKLQGRLHRGDSIRVLVVDSKVVLLERRFETPLSKRRVLRLHGPPERIVETTRGEFLDYRRFGYDIVDGFARAVVFFRWKGESRVLGRVP